MIVIQLLGIFFVLITSLSIDYFELKKAKKERKVVIIYGLLMLLATIVSLEIVFKLDLLNPNRVIENIVKTLLSEGKP